MADQKRSWAPLAGNPRLCAQAEANLDALAAAVQAQPGLTVAEYGERLLRRFTEWDAGKRNDVLERLVHGYPSHDYIIDYQELREIGFDASLFEADTRDAVRGLFTPIAEGTTTVFCLDVETPEESAEPAESTEAACDDADETPKKAG